jgi:hypothetical protein
MVNERVEPALGVTALPRLVKIVPKDASVLEML